jgi:hypothetical protein
MNNNLTFLGALGYIGTSLTAYALDFPMLHIDKNIFSTLYFVMIAYFKGLITMLRR